MRVNKNVGATSSRPHIEEITKNNVGAGPVSARKERGITLIALIITIIVMLILVMVSIRIAIQTGLFDSAGKATQKWDKAQDAEAELGNGKVNIDGTTYESIDEYMESITPLPEIKEGERATDGNATYKGVTIPEGFTVSNIPGEYENVDDGIVIYDIPAEDLADENFSWTADGDDSDTYPDVQQKYNQFVWVPVEKAYKDVYITVAKINEIIAANETEINAMVSDTSTYSHIVSQEQAAIQLLVENEGKFPMAVQMTNGNYRGILYEFDNWNGTIGINVLEFSSSETVSYENVATADKVSGITYATYFREPGTTSYDRNSYTSYGITQTRMQTEYNNMVTSVAKYGGFYVARYELTQETVTENGTSTLEFGSKRGQTVANASISSAYMWYGLNKACNGLYNKTTDKVQSQMISGAQWDQIMIWMRSVPNRTTTGKYFINYSTDMGNYADSDDYSSTNLISGRVDNFSVKKVFDLGGNLYDWTTEAGVTNRRVLRGDYYYNNGSDYPASGRNNGHYPIVTASRFTSRSSLYIKSL